MRSSAVDQGAGDRERCSRPSPEEPVDTIDLSSLRLLHRQLANRSPLSVQDRDALLALPHLRRTLEPATYLVREGETLEHCAVLIEGFVFRQKLTRDGNRQIVSIQIPGDPLDFQQLYLDVADHNVQALTRADVALVPRAAIETLIAERPAVARAVAVNNQVAASIGREWQLNIGRRNARARLAHLLCEFACRMEAQGLAGNHGSELPMTQEQFGDALGLTSVHVNRTLKQLEREGVIRRNGRRIGFDDWDAIRSVAGFSSLYLHLQDKPVRRLDAAAPRPY